VVAEWAKLPEASFTGDLDVALPGERWVAYDAADGMDRTAFPPREGFDMAVPGSDVVHSNVVRVVVGTPFAVDYGAEVVVLEYGAFGPQGIAYELVGFEWYQWASHGHEESDYRYNIKILVCEEDDVEAVKKRYPVVKGKVDYRYVSRGKAIAFLDTRAKELEALAKTEDEPSGAECFRGLAQKLRATREKIASHEFERLGRN
jgi:hypothetical protein